MAQTQPHDDAEAAMVVLYKQMVSLKNEIAEEYERSTKIDPATLTIQELHGRLVDTLSLMNDLAALNAEALVPLDDEPEDDEDEEGEALLDEEEGALIIGLITDYRALVEKMNASESDPETQAAYTKRITDCDRAIDIVNDIVGAEEE